MGRSPRGSKRNVILAGSDAVWWTWVRECKTWLMTSVTNEAIKRLSLANERERSQVA